MRQLEGNGQGVPPAAAGRRPNGASVNVRARSGAGRGIVIEGESKSGRRRGKWEIVREAEGGESVRGAGGEEREVQKGGLREGESE